jgi:hypothetical protein
VVLSHATSGPFLVPQDKGMEICEDFLPVDVLFTMPCRDAFRKDMAIVDTSSSDSFKATCVGCNIVIGSGYCRFIDSHWQTPFNPLRGPYRQGLEVGIRKLGAGCGKYRTWLGRNHDSLDPYSFNQGMHPRVPPIELYG